MAALGVAPYAATEATENGEFAYVETFARATDAKHQLTRVESWIAPTVPCGLARYRAIAKDVEPFEMHVYSYGTHFKSGVAMSLETIRSITPDGTYVDAG